jgi:UDP-GlcNAc:undecaprenyl-phosphate GlcNAc-1-phosphate transferase
MAYQQIEVEGVAARPETVLKIRGGKRTHVHLLPEEVDQPESLIRRIQPIRAFCHLSLAAAAISLMLPFARTFFQANGWRWLHVLLLSFSLSCSLIPVLIFLARRFRFVDQPENRKLHQKATPLMGGGAVFAGFSVSLLFNNIFNDQIAAIMCSATVLFGLGLIDDVKELPAVFKLLTQFACAFVVMAFGIFLRVIPQDFGWVADIGNAMLTLFWLIGITNAMNFFDGMDGLAAGLGALIAFFLAVVSFQTQQPLLGWVSLALIGGCLGFLPFNFRRRGNASIFLGDAGSTVIGFILACIAVYGDWAEGRPLVALVSPVLIFGLLIFDMIHITLDRILSGKVANFKQWIEYVGKDHLHHRLADALGDKKKSVLFIYMMGLCLGISAVSLRHAGAVEALLLLVQAAIMVLLITVLEKKGRRVLPGRHVAGSEAGRASARSVKNFYKKI